MVVRMLVFANKLSEKHGSQARPMNLSEITWKQGTRAEEWHFGG